MRQLAQEPIAFVYTDGDDWLEDGASDPASGARARRQEDTRANRAPRMWRVNTPHVTAAEKPSPVGADDPNTAQHS